MRIAALALLASCSYVGVRAPPKVDLATVDPRTVRCNDSGILPGLDALGGAGAIAVMGGGILLEHTTDKERYDHFTLYYAAPTLALAIFYFYSASFGTTRITKCSEIKEAAAHKPVSPVTPIDQQHDAENPNK